MWRIFLFGEPLDEAGMKQLVFYVPFLNGYGTVVDTRSENIFLKKHVFRRKYV